MQPVRSLGLMNSNPIWESRVLKIQNKYSSPQTVSLHQRAETTAHHKVSIVFKHLVGITGIPTEHFWILNFCIC